MIQLHYVLTSIYIVILNMTLNAQPSLKAEPTQTVVEAGQVFSIRYILSNEESNQFYPGSTDPFRVVMGPSRITSINIINGKRSSQTSWTYQLMAPRDPGDFVIGSSSVRVGRYTYQSEEIKVRVIEANKDLSTKKKSASGIDDKKYFITVEASTEHAWPGQLVLLSCKIYSKVNIASFEMVQAPQIEEASVHMLRRFNAGVQREVIGNEVYFSKLFQQWAVFPQTPGSLTIDPFVIKLALEEEKDKDYWFNFFKSYTYETITSNALTLEVHPLPKPAPEGFSGAVGELNASLSLSTERITAGQSFTATLTLSGTGDLKRIRPPDINWPDAIEQYDITSTDEGYQDNGSTVTGLRTFEYILVPGKSESVNIPVFFDYFDPVLAAYRTIDLSLPDVEIWPGESQPDTGLDMVTERPIAPENVESDSFWRKTGIYVATGLILLVLTGIVMMRRRQEKSVKELMGKDRPIHTLESALKSGDINMYLLELERIIYRWAGMKIREEPSRLTGVRVREIMDQYIVERKDAQKITELLTLCEQSLYSPVKTGFDMENVHRDVLDFMEKYFDKS